MPTVWFGILYEMICHILHLAVFKMAGEMQCVTFLPFNVPHLKPIHFYFFYDPKTAYLAFCIQPTSKWILSVLALTVWMKPLCIELLCVFQRWPVLGRGPALRSWSWGWSRAKLTSRTLPLSWMLRSYRHPSHADRFLGTSSVHFSLSISWFWRWTCSVQHVGSLLHTTVITRLCLTEWCSWEDSAGWI